MPRRARVVVPGLAHHVTQRGNHRKNVFFSEADRNIFLELLRLYSKRSRLQVASYCLMTNHTHLIVIPETPESLWRTFKPLHMRYSQHLNQTATTTGLNWQGRYFSSPMDESHTYEAFQYVALNPVRAGIVARAEYYQWSSARAHLYDELDPVLNANDTWSKMARSSLSELIDSEHQQFQKKSFFKIAQNTGMNIPIGSDHFISKLEKQTGRTLRFKTPGRPRKKG